MICASARCCPLRREDDSVMSYWSLEARQMSQAGRSLIWTCPGGVGGSLWTCMPEPPPPPRWWAEEQPQDLLKHIFRIVGFIYGAATVAGKPVQSTGRNLEQDQGHGRPGLTVLLTLIRTSGNREGEHQPVAQL